ncbi:MAG: hypothetical protein OEW29_10545 [Acidimicrobiia bacterium]|nr:hypothetical protein [Acidimicrobiia bacterium]
MMRRTSLAAGAASLLFSLALAACGSDSEPTSADTATSPNDPGANGPLGGGAGAIGTVEIEITRPDTDPVRFTIGCMGDTFPVTPEVEGIDGATACTRLGEAEVLARLTEGPPADRTCTEIYGGPDVATITGELNGEAIDTTVDRTNGCGIADWDDLLAGVLPPSKGAA